jgi:hypothetical protein
MCERVCDIYVKRVALPLIKRTQYVAEFNALGSVGASKVLFPRETTQGRLNIIGFWIRGFAYPIPPNFLF